MQHRFEYHLRRDDYVAGLSLLFEQLRRSDRPAKRRAWEQVAMVVAVLAIVGVLFPNAITGVLVAAFLVSVFEFVLRPRWMRGAHGISYDPALSDMTITFDDNGISETTQERLRQWPWSAVRQVHEIDAGLIFELAGWDMVILPARLWSDRAGRAAFVEELPCKLATPDPNLPSKFGGAAFNELLPLAAFAVPLELLFMAVTFAPARWLSQIRPSGPEVFWGGLIATLIVLAALGYALYRLVRVGLIRLQNRSARAAAIVIQLIVWTVMVTTLAVVFGWL